MSLLDDLFPLLIAPYRAIGTIIPDVVIEEDHRDQTIVTDHPVEHGAAISDHAFMRPSEVMVRVGYSNSTGGTSGYVQDAYEQFLQLQRAREPFTVSTGKRLYQNMLISSLQTTTNDKTENALILTVGLREIIIVETQTTGTGKGKAAQANPASTAPEIAAGSRSVQDTGATVPDASFSLGSGFTGTAFGIGGPAAIAGQDGITLPPTTAGAFAATPSGF